MPNILKRWLINTFTGRTALQKPLRLAHFLAVRGLNYGGGAETSSSGEAWAFRDFLSKTGPGPLTIFDVGANVGSYSAMCLKLLGDREAVIHAFEPSMETCRRLQGNLHDTRVITHQLALGAKEGRAVIFSDAPASGYASVYKRRLDHFNIQMDMEEEVPMATLDSFCAKNGIRQIHFLKIDVEGNELNVLHGAERLLKEGRIDRIQFEFGGCNIDSRTYFQDFFYLLNPQYRIHRVMRDGLFPIDKYSEFLEIFVTANFVAVRR